MKALDVTDHDNLGRLHFDLHEFTSRAAEACFIAISRNPTKRTELLCETAAECFDFFARGQLTGVTTFTDVSSYEDMLATWRWPSIELLKKAGLDDFEENSIEMRLQSRIQFWMREAFKKARGERTSADSPGGRLDSNGGSGDHNVADEDIGSNFDGCVSPQTQRPETGGDALAKDENALRPTIPSAQEHTVISEQVDEAAVVSSLGGGIPLLIESGSRKILVHHFLVRCREAGVLVIKKHIWSSVGHTKPRQFQYWQSGSPKSTAGDEQNFRRVLAMTPEAFRALLNQLGIKEARR